MASKLALTAKTRRGRLGDRTNALRHGVMGAQAIAYRLGSNKCKAKDALASVHAIRYGSGTLT